MKIEKETNQFDTVIFMINDLHYCGNCRNRLSLSISKCVVCGTVFTETQIADSSIRITADLFDQLYLKQDIFTEQSDFRGKILVVQTNQDIISSSDELLELEERQRLAQRINDSHIPREYRWKQISDFIKTRVSTYPFQAEKTISYFWGNNNTGKTLAACIILHSFLEDERTGFFSSMDKIIATKYASWKGESDFDALLNADIVVIDDAFDSRKTYIRDNTPTIPIIDDFLRHRVHNRLFTIITTNISLDMLEQSSNFRQIRRLIDRSIFIVEFK